MTAAPALPPLPPGWEWTELEKIGFIYSGGTPSTSDTENFDGNIPWITPADLSGYNEKYISRGKRNITQKGLATSSATLIPSGSVLFSSRAPIGYVAIASNEFSTNQGFKSIKPRENILSDYVYYYLKSIKQLVESQSSGTTFLEISKSRFSKLPFPLPPTLADQQHIVDKIEELFSRLDAAEAALRRARANLKRYRQAVLQAAVTGELTREWREAHRGQIEPADALLQRIRAERARTGKPAVPAPNAANLPSLPDGWEWASLDEITLKIGDVDHRMPKPADSNIPYISTKDFFGSNEIKFENAKKISKEDYSQLTRKIKPEKNDILLSRYGTVGEIRKVETDAIFQVSYSIAIIKTLPFSVLVDYLVFCLRSSEVQKQIKKFTRATAQPDLGLSHIRELNVPLPPETEQIIINNLLDQVNSSIEKIEITIIDNLQRIFHLRQSILQRAFSGQLLTFPTREEPAP